MPTRALRVTHSLIDTDALLRILCARYRLPPDLSCNLWHPGDSDLYLLTSGGGSWIARLYQHTKASQLAVEAETEIVRRLAQCGLPVTPALEGIDGQRSIAIEAPEGPRQLTITSYVPGRPAGARLSTNQAEGYGRLAAAIHSSLDGFLPAFARPVLDAAALVQQPISAILSVLHDHPTESTYLQHLALELPVHVDLSRSVSSWGLCHGDLHKSNVLVGDDDALTVIDWECCSYTWRAYELAVLRWSIGPAVGPDGLGPAHTAALWTHYLDGYQTVRVLETAELAAMPYFVAARHLWILSVNVQHVRDGHWGTSYIRDLLPDSVADLRRWTQQYCPDIHA